MDAIGFGSRIVALLVGLAGPSDRLADFPAEAEVIVAVLDVFDEPDEASMVSARLQQGDRITVRDLERPGWLTIDPPPGSFCWIEQTAVGVGDGLSRARVIAPSAVVRSGHPQAKLPGTPRVELAQGTIVQLLNRAPLTLGQGRDLRTWRAIAPPPADVRHIRASGVRFEPKPVPPPIAETRAAYEPPVVETATPPEVADAIAQIESIHRAALRQPVEQWRLEEVRSRYEALLRSVTDTAAGNAIRVRLDVVARHDAIARDARQFETLLARSRRRDGAVALYQRRLADLAKPQAQPYNISGLIQASSRQVGGQKVFALIGRDGMTQAYLDIPPGINVKGLLTRRVGVRGTIEYDETLRARVIKVRDLEPLDAERQSLSGK